MSWPDDRQPRFKVETVSGFRINPGQGISSPSNTRKPNTAAQVLDRAYCDRIVAVFDRVKRTQWPDGPVAAAYARAYELNKRDQAAG